MPNKRIVLDTNLWISFLISKKYENLDSLILSDQITLLYSKELIEEYLEVSRRPKFARFFQSRDVQDLLVLLLTFGELVVIETEVNYCRDPKDNFLLSLAVNGKADFLITGDSDLLVLEKFIETKITTWKDFFESWK